MKVYLMYKEFNLGYLAVEDNKYIWNPNVSDIQDAKKKYLGMEVMLLPSFRAGYDNVPPHYSDFLAGSEREDLVLDAGIKTKDSSFERLFKLGKLEYMNQEFVIKS